MTNYPFDPQEFANAYIQTLDYKATVDDHDDVREFLDERRKVYLNEYLRAYTDAIEFHQEIDKKLTERNN